MLYFILFFGVLISLGSAMLIVRPQVIFGVFKKYGDSLGLHIFAVVIRVFFGIALVIGAPETRYPGVIQVLGWITIIAGLAIAVIGRKRFKKVSEWVINLPAGIYYPASVLGLLFGGFIIYSAV